MLLAARWIGPVRVNMIGTGTSSLFTLPSGSIRARFKEDRPNFTWPSKVKEIPFGLVRSPMNANPSFGIDSVFENLTSSLEWV